MRKREADGHARSLPHSHSTKPGFRSPHSRVPSTGCSLVLASGDPSVPPVHVAAACRKPPVASARRGYGRTGGEMGTEAGEPSSLLSLSAAFSYGIASMAMVFVNKAILMQYVHSMTLLTLQQIATALIIHFGQVLGVSKRKDFSIATGRKLLPVSIFYNANVAFALASLKGVNIPMYIAIKRLTPLAVLVAGCLRGKGKPPTQVSLSVICTATGVLIAALGDFSFDLYGYSMALISVFFQVTMYLILVEKSGAEDGLSSVELMFYNSVLSLPFLFFIIIATGEFPYSLSVLSEKTASLTFSLILVISLVMGIFLNFTMFWCTIVNSALTTTIVGVLKGVGSTTLGFVLLGGVEVHTLNIIGLVINTFGGVWYSYAKYMQKRKTPRKIASDVEAHPHK
uniref:Sugar phosphate transporter domain-containing protein n=1 Tax=Leersia perrieri TaxID=77586 RepID=A0A0D9WMS3_9ORYZ